MAALRRAVRADPHFAVAAIDLSVLDGSEPASAARFLHTWERHHIEVVLAAAQGNDCRAVDLLREHLTAVTCDPIAIAVVLGAPNQEPLDDILRRLPSCHHQPGTALRPSRARWVIGAFERLALPGPPQLWRGEAARASACWMGHEKL